MKSTSVLSKSKTIALIIVRKEYENEW